jgi:hypothetical protein
MRIKIVVPLLLAGLLAVLLPFVVRFKPPATSSAKGTGMPVANMVAPGTGPAGKQAPGHLPRSLAESQPDLHVTTDTCADDLPAAKYEDYVNRRVAELGDLAMTGNAGSLLTIESELDSRDPRIQAAAVSATIQFGSRDAIPALRDAYGHTDDPAQKLKLRKAIEFLELPTASETANGSPSGAGDSTTN